MARVVWTFTSVSRSLLRECFAAQPLAIPIEQPANFDLVINVRTAKERGLSIPLSMLGRADEVIE